MKYFAVISGVVAAVALGGPWLFRTHMDGATHVSLLLALCWVLAYPAAIIRFGKRALWLLLELPLVLFWPFVHFIIGWNSAQNIKNCP
jgi:hypothetical protein